jgi:murein L,D-transpeptidase YafK
MRNYRHGSRFGKATWILGQAVLVVAVVGLWANWPYAELPTGTVADHLVVKKSARVLELYRGAELIRRYPVSLGRTPRGPKQQAGDGRPEGPYRLDYRKLDSSFHRALHISYPGKDDVAAARVRGVDPGGLIMVHGMKNGLGWMAVRTEPSIGPTDVSRLRIARSMR